MVAGLGIGLGVMAEQADWNDGFISLFIITFIGLGFVGAFFISRKFEKEDEVLETIIINKFELILLDTSPHDF